MSNNTHNSPNSALPSDLRSPACDLKPRTSDLRPPNSEFIPYGKQLIEQDDIDAVVEVLKSDYLTTGPAVKAFEQALCERTGAEYCVAVANGTAALHLAVAALEIEPGREGITSPITFLASANSMAYCGLTPRFCDIDPDTYCMSPDALEQAITERTALVTPVHFAGYPANMTLIADIAERHDLRVIEDAAHAIGSQYPDGSPVGNCKYSDMTIFSFHPVKTITTGEGGAITTNDPVLYERLMLLRNHGITKDPNKFGAPLTSDLGPPPSDLGTPTSDLRPQTSETPPWLYAMTDLGFNYRITDLQCALGLSQLKKLNSFITRRQEIVDKYNTAFADIPFVKCPVFSRLSSCKVAELSGKPPHRPSTPSTQQPINQQPTIQTAWHLYVLQIDFEQLGKSRTEVMAELREQGIGTQVHYIPVYKQPYYRTHFSDSCAPCANAEQYYIQCLSLPLYPAMADGDVDKVIESVKQIIKAE